MTSFHVVVVDVVVVDGGVEAFTVLFCTFVCDVVFT
jgi:hypothetical protein